MSRPHLSSSSRNLAIEDGKVGTGSSSDDSSDSSSTTSSSDEGDPAPEAERPPQSNSEQPPQPMNVDSLLAALESKTEDFERIFEALHYSQEELEEAKAEIAERDLRIQHLEAQLQALRSDSDVEMTSD